MNLFKILLEILDVKDNFLTFWMLNKFKPGCKKISKRASAFLFNSDSVVVNQEIKLKSEKVKRKTKNLITKYINEPEKVLRLIEMKGTKVIQAPYLSKILILLGQEEGFIAPFSGIKALILNLAINILSAKKVRFGFKTEPMIAIGNRSVSIYFIAHQCYHWIAYMQKLPGYEEQTLKNFKNVWSSNLSNEAINTLSIDDILSLKDAIARDVEAIECVKEISRELIGSKTSLDRLKNGESLNL